MFVVDYLSRSLTFYENAFPRGQEPDWAAHHHKGVSEGPVHAITIEKREPLRVQLEAFARSVRDGTPPAVSADDAIAAIAASQALVRSARSGEGVVVAGAVM
jgi:predicted dehydrogenase